MGEGLGYETQLLKTRFSRSLFIIDGAVLGHEFKGGHAGNPHDDKPRFLIKANQLVDRIEFVMTAGVFPETAIDRVMKVKVLEILELGSGVIEEGLHHLDVGIHGPAAVVDGM